MQIENRGVCFFAPHFRSNAISARRGGPLARCPPGKPWANNSMNARTSIQRSPELLSRNDSRLLVVDMQAKLLPFIPVAQTTIRNCRRLIEGARILGVPFDATEQYPKGLGPTTPELAGFFEKVPDKQRFSCTEALDWASNRTAADDRFKIVVAGIEAHVCVLQTVLDLIAHGFRVFVPADAVASRAKLDWKVALERMSSSGATITTTESALFEWCETSGAKEFKQISALVKERE
jgi:nicotinamidase-related amidase